MKHFSLSTFLFAISSTLLVASTAHAQSNSTAVPLNVTMSDGQASAGSPHQTIRCLGERQDDETKLTCDVRLSEPVNVSSVSAQSADNSDTGRWDSSYRASTLATDDSVFLFLVDASDPGRRRILSRATQDISKILEGIGPRQLGAVYSFSSQLTQHADFTSDGTQLAQALQSIEATGQATELYRLTKQAIALLGPYADRRRILVILSDGAAEDTIDTLESVVEVAKEENIRIVTIGYPASASKTPDLQSLRVLADSTNGTFLQAAPANNQIDDEARINFIRNLTSGGVLTATSSGNERLGPVELTIEFENGGTVTGNAVIAEGNADPTSDTMEVSGFSVPEDFSFDGILAWLQARPLVFAALAAGVPLLLGLIVFGATRRNEKEGASREDDTFFEQQARPSSESLVPIAPAPTPVEPTPRAEGRSDPPADPVALSGDVARIEAGQKVDASVQKVRPRGGISSNKPDGAIATLKTLPDGETFFITRSTTKIGRRSKPVNDIVFADGNVSRVHAEVNLTSSDKLVIRNLTADRAETEGGINPIFVNNEDIGEMSELANNDVIRLGNTGDTKLIFTRL